MKKVMTSIFRGLKVYLCNWRNLLGHALLGAAFLAAAIWVPISLWIKLAIIACLIAFNIIRMRRTAKTKNALAETKTPSENNDIIQEGERS